MDTRRLIWRETAEVLGVLGVIGSLIFVALEIHQNTNAVRSATIQAISEQSYDIAIRVAESADLRAVQRAAESGDELSVDQRDQLFAIYGALMRIQENRFQQLQLGILDEETVFQVGGRGRGYRSPFFRRFWEENGDSYPVEFQEWVEKELLPLSLNQSEP